MLYGELDNRGQGPGKPGVCEPAASAQRLLCGREDNAMGAAPFSCLFSLPLAFCLFSCLQQEKAGYRAWSKTTPFFLHGCPPAISIQKSSPGGVVPVMIFLSFSLSLDLLCSCSPKHSSMLEVAAESNVIWQGFHFCCHNLLYPAIDGVLMCLTGSKYGILHLQAPVLLDPKCANAHLQQHQLAHCN